MSGELVLVADAVLVTAPPEVIEQPCARCSITRLATDFAVRAVLFAFGLFMSLWRLDVLSWNGDELIYAAAGNNYWNGDYRYNPEHPPLGKVLIGVSEHIFGQTLWAARLPAAMAALLGGCVLWAWLSRAVGPAAGRTAAVFWWALPGLTSFPELLPGRSLDLPQRWALLDPLAGALALGALAAGWWWLRGGRLAAALTSGLLAGAAVATKLPAVLIVVVPGAVGPLATLLRPGPAWVAHLPVHAEWSRPSRVVFTAAGRLPRAVGHAATWLAGGFTAFAMAYASMGARQAVDSIRAGWRMQRAHGSGGHSVLLDGQVYQHAPWWALAWWQWMALGGAVAVIALVATAAGLALRSGLTAYLAAAWLIPLLLLVPVSHLALPHYDIIWRGPLVGAAVAGGAVAIRWLRALSWPRLRPYTPVLAGLLLLVALAPPGALALRTAAHTMVLEPAGYGALPAIAGPGEVHVVGSVPVVRKYLPQHTVVGVRNTPRQHVPAPGTIVLDRATTSRSTDFGLTAWGIIHHYRHVHTGTLDIYFRPH
jgi:hypothetical protein